MRAGVVPLNFNERFEPWVQKGPAWADFVRCLMGNIMSPAAEASAMPVSRQEPRYSPSQRSILDLAISPELRPVEGESSENEDRSVYAVLENRWSAQCRFENLI